EWHDGNPLGAGMTDATLFADAPPIEADACPTCDYCGQPFEPRTGSGGKPQRFCSADCRSTFHAQRGQRAPTCDAQSEPTATQRRLALIEGVKDFDSKNPPETATELVDRMLQSHRERTRKDFDWEADDSDSIIFHKQPRTAVYLNGRDQVVIRQEDEY